MFKVSRAAEIPHSHPLSEDALPAGFPFLISTKTEQIVEPVLAFLCYRYLYQRGTWRPNTVDAICYDLLDWWNYLSFRELEWAHAEVEDVIDFRNSLLATVSPRAHRKISRVLWRQSSAMKDAGCSYLPERPFDLPITKIAEKLSSESLKLTPALPDEVSVPIMNAAARFLQHCAPDIVRLHRMYLAAISDEDLLHHKSNHARNAKAKKAIESFVFSTIPGELRPWREQIPDMGPIIYRNPATLGSTECATVDAIHHLRALLFDVRDACALIIQSQAGVRISELCSLESGTNPETGLPSCIEVRKSKTGLNELFYLKGRISKTVRAPLEVEWILGSRPYGSPELPSPVKAVSIIEETFSHWRKFARDAHDEKSLFVTFLCRRGFPKSERQVISATAGSIADGQNLFIRKYIDLSSLPPTSRHGEDLSRFREVSSSPIRTHQWRKSYALYIFKTDSRMIPAIAQQFHHVSLAMTEQGYLSNDPELLEAIDSARKESTCLGIGSA